MNANLLVDFLQLVQENLLLVIVLGVIAVLIVALAIVLIVLSVKAKKIAPAAQTEAENNAAAEEPAKAEAQTAAPVSEPEPVAEESEAAEKQPSPEKQPEAEAAPYTPEPIFKEEAPEQTKPAKTEPKSEPKPAAETKKADEVKEDVSMSNNEEKPAKRASASPYVYKPGKAEPAPAAPAKTGANGKWVIEEVKGRYWFSLYANNGQVMLESATAYATLASARSGIKTYQDNIAGGRLEITEHKNGDFQVQILNARGGLLATSSTYGSRGDCEKAMESIKRWATSTTIEEAGKDE